MNVYIDLTRFWQMVTDKKYIEITQMILESINEQMTDLERLNNETDIEA